MIYYQKSIDTRGNRGVWENRSYIFYFNVKKFYMALYYKM